MPDPIFSHPPDPGIPPPIPPSAPAPVSAPGSTVNARGRLIDPAVTHNQRTYAMLIHASILAAVIMLFLSVVIPLVFVLSFVVPLAMWLAKRDQSRFIDDHGRETVNFHLTIALYAVISVPLMVICIGWLTLIAVYILAIIGGLMACLAASRGEYFRYPMCIRFIR